jgi:hypothetical protein
MILNLPRDHHAVNISSDIQRLGEAAVELFIHEHNLTSIGPRRQISINNTAHKCDGTIEEYEARWEEMRKFFYMIGDSQSATLCHRLKCPDNPLPFNAESFMQYLDFKYGSATQLLRKHGTNEPLLDIMGNQIMCQGTWHSPNQSNKIRSAVYCLHNHYEVLRGPYVVTCPDCVSIHDTFKQQPDYRAGSYGSCLRHASGSVLNSSGNVCLSEDVKIKLDRWKENKAAYRKKGSMQMTPSQVRVLRNLLLSSGDINDMKTYVMILLGIKLFLRADELVQLKLDMFGLDYQIVSIDSVRALAVTIKGKNDTVPVTLMIFSDDDCPEFCPVRHLLAYVKKAGLKEGYLFPGDLELQLRKPDGNYKHHIAYPTFLRTMRNLLKDTLGLTLGKGALGTHTLRKTGYLFAYWGVMGEKFWMQSPLQDKFVPELQLSNILKSARHKSIQNAATYQQDAAAVLAMVEREQFCHDQRVSRWESIYVVDGGNAHIVVTPSRFYQKPLVEMATFYFDTCLHLTTSSMTVSTLMSLICSTVPAESKHEKLKTILAKFLPAKELYETLDLLSGAICEAIGSVQDVAAAATGSVVAASSVVAAPTTADTLSPTTAVAVSPSTTSLPAASTEQPPQKKRRIRKGGDDDLEGRDKVIGCGKDHKAKMTMIKALHDRVGEDRSALTEKARVWYTKNVVKPMRCLAQCHGGSVDHFVEDAIPVFFRSKQWRPDHNFPTHQYVCSKCNEAG